VGEADGSWGAFFPEQPIPYVAILGELPLRPDNWVNGKTRLFRTHWGSLVVPVKESALGEFPPKPSYISLSS